MYRITIEIRHPLRMLLIIGGIVGLVLAAQYFTDRDLTANAVGGSGEVEQQQRMDAEQEVYKLRVEQAVLSHREEILRYQLRLLENERDAKKSTWVQEDQARWQESVDELRSLLMDRKRAEDQLRRAFYRIWEAQSHALRVSRSVALVPLILSWPVEPLLGISAYYLDASYEERFGIPHQAIDIPTKQGTVIRAPAAGTVEEISEHEDGFSYIILKHEGGATLYGHISASLVSEGDIIRRGDAIALSGGEPGTLGAGVLSTGPHLHFEVMVNGVHVDPMEYLPPGL